jgi:uncharacterized protein (TIGR02588 family)
MSLKERSEITSSEKDAGRSPAEWFTFGIASAILATVIGLISYVWVTKKEQPPILSISREKAIQNVNGQFYVPFILKNQGGETAESVHVVANLELKNETEESGEQEIDFLSSGEKQEGAFIFSQNPQQGKLTIRVVSYKLP